MPRSRAVTAGGGTHSPFLEKLVTNRRARFLACTFRKVALSINSLVKRWRKGSNKNWEQPKIARKRVSCWLLHFRKVHIAALMCKRKVIYALSHRRNILIRQKQRQLDENVGNTIKLPIFYTAQRRVLNDPSAAFMKKVSLGSSRTPSHFQSSMFFKNKVFC